ncbi:hypothetical protein E2C01_049426 [Portunus trituberculatus]|uniref:Uncharacterized protein n=1 Tax=Portunus trituberculatus TaxID=210409 RepID=A0A5B7GEE3_PORTR|nr:hypothetical protein [Portunus trituberculatus]
MGVGRGGREGGRFPVTFSRSDRETTACAAGRTLVETETSGVSFGTMTSRGSVGMEVRRLGKDGAVR